MLPTHRHTPGLMGLLQWCPGHWDVPKVPLRFLTSLPGGGSPAACAGRRVCRLLPPAARRSLINYGSSRKLLLH